jgi:hypothetical protein
LRAATAQHESPAGTRSVVHPETDSNHREGQLSGYGTGCRVTGGVMVAEQDKAVRRVGASLLVVIGVFLLVVAIVVVLMVAL